MHDIRTGADGFVQDLADCGVVARILGGGVEYSVPVVLGDFDGEVVRTSVAIAELGGWPATPPHWIHLAGEFNFATTNAEASELAAGWRKHSRQVSVWLPADHPGHAWISHVRAVLAEAVKAND